MNTDSSLTHLECARCGTHHEADRLQGLCTACSGPLLARYDLERAGRTLTRAAITSRPPGLWRYAEVLPVSDPRWRISLGEGGTPLLPSRRIGARLGLPRLFFKEEGLNPTGSFKARGLCVAVSRAAELGARAFTIPTAGNAGGALAAYAAAAGIPAHVYMPADTPARFAEECRVFGAHVVMVDGFITDAGKRAREEAQGRERFDVSTLREPYRIEGKKTMGYELLEDFGGELPDLIIYPTGGGTGLVGMWKAFEEMEALGWCGAHRPRMVAVQAEGCAPVIKAFHEGADRYDPWPDPRTCALGLRVPAATGDREILKVLRDSAGTAVAVDEEAMLASTDALGHEEGIYASPEDGAALAALRLLRDSGQLDPSERIALFLTGSGTKYARVMDQARQALGNR